MTKITLELGKSLGENASAYFDAAKKARAKAERAKEALKQSEKKLILLAKAEPEKKQIEIKKVRKKEWFEKFRWFTSSEGFLVIGGRDSTTNEIVIKKHTDKNDIVFHTDMAGSPFFVIKTRAENSQAETTVEKKPGEATFQEVANATASYSRAWKMGYTTTDVFYVNPDQVSKTAQAGEALPHGAFMIYGKTTYLRPEMKCAIGIKEGTVIGGPVNAIKANAEKYIVIVQGEDKPSDIAKKVKKLLGDSSLDLDEIIRFLPPGNCRIEKIPTS
jgi:predicted ribosome quality control (RQC) complex YloA/Tae2 family protein